MRHSVTVGLDDSDFEVTIWGTAPRGGQGGTAPVHLRFAPPKLATGLSDITVLLNATRGELTPDLRTHFAEHFGGGQYGTGSCGFCKLQGKILAALGRRPLNDAEHRARAVPPPLEPRLCAFGASHANEVRAAQGAAAREAERLRKLPRLNGLKPGDTTGVVF